jgi:hypothetical protein
MSLSIDPVPKPVLSRPVLEFVIVLARVGVGTVSNHAMDLLAPLPYIDRNISIAPVPIVREQHAKAFMDFAYINDWRTESIQWET